MPSLSAEQKQYAKQLAERLDLTTEEGMLDFAAELLQWQSKQRANVPPTDAQVASACMSYRHDFGMLDGAQRSATVAEAREWLRAWRKESFC